MILKALYARNFMKYRELAVSAFPDEGIVGIVGENESGKTTILEAVSYGLFGKCVKADEQEFMKLIHWRYSKMEVSLQFEHDKHLYRVIRSCDRDGDREALLYRKDMGQEQLVASGSGAVRDFICGIFPVGFDAFRQSFYLGQKELSALYEKRLPNSQEILDEITGLSRLKKVLKSVTDKLPEQEASVRALEREIELNHVRVESLEERLEEQEVLEGDLERQKQKLHDAGDFLQRENQSLEKHEKIRWDLGRLKESFLQLKSEFIGCELKRRAKHSGVKLLRLFNGIIRKKEELEQEKKRLEQQLETAVNSSTVSRAVLDEIRVLKALARERMSQLQAQMDSQFGSTNFKSYFLPSTLKEQVVLGEYQVQGVKKRIQSDRAAFLFALTLLLLTLGGAGALWVKGQGIFMTADILAKTGVVLFGGALLVILFSLVLEKRQSLSQAKDTCSKLQLNVAKLQRDFTEAEEEMSVLSRLEQGSFDNFEQLAQWRGRVRYSALRDAITALLSQYEGKTSDIELDLEKYRTLQDACSNLKAELDAVNSELASLNQIQEDFASVKSEVEQWSFVGVVDSYDTPEQLTGEMFQTVGLLVRLKQLLKGDFSWDEGVFESHRTSYNDRIDSFLREEGEHSNLPDIWDEKRVRWTLEFAMMQDLQLEDALAKFKALDEQEQYMENLRMSATERFHKKSEQCLGSKSDKMTCEQRVTFMEEALFKLRQVRSRVRDIREETELLQKRFESLRHEFNRSNLLKELLEGTIDSVRTRLSDNLSRFIGVILSRVTDGRYEKVRVSEQLEVQVFSPEADAYVDLMTLSGGTVDQLLISLRLALASSVLQSGFKEGDGNQFLFLDEPLYAFDSKRAEQFLELIIEFNPAFRQIFIVTHNQNLIQKMSHRIETSRERAELSIA